MASILARSKPMITSLPITMVGVPRLLYLSTRSCRAEGSSETLRSRKLTPLSERYSFAAWHGPQPLAVKISMGFSAMYDSSFLSVPVTIPRLVTDRSRPAVGVSSRWTSVLSQVSADSRDMTSLAAVNHQT